MDSELARVDTLLHEGQQFTFENFCRPHYSAPRRYAGEETPEWTTWVTRVVNFIHQTMDQEAPAARLISDGAYLWTEGNPPETFERKRECLLKALQQAKQALEEDTHNELKRESASPPSAVDSNRVFIVHGHDDALKTDLEAFLHARGLEPVVLHRQPDGGRTLIEKFEEYSDVGYAFILLTPDDLSLPDETVEKLREGAIDPSLCKYRARQNVIFEFGFFVGRLGRDRVCCLYKGGVELPSDLRGLVYKKVNKDIESMGWPLIQELRHAGYELKL